MLCSLLVLLGNKESLLMYNWNFFLNWIAKVLYDRRNLKHWLEDWANCVHLYVAMFFLFCFVLVLCVTSGRNWVANKNRSDLRHYQMKGLTSKVFCHCKCPFLTTGWPFCVPVCTCLSNVPNVDAKTTSAIWFRFNKSDCRWQVIMFACDLSIFCTFWWSAHVVHIHEGKHAKWIVPAMLPILLMQS